MSKILDKTTFRGLDGLRAIACIMVMVHHAGQRIDVSKLASSLVILFDAFQSGVSIFFVLSGFLLSSPFWRNYSSNKDIPDLKIYYIRRWARIMPGYFISLVVTFIFTYFFLGNVTYPWIRLIAGLTFTSCLHWITLFPVELNGPLWSISFEVFSYVLLAIVMLIIFKLSKKRNFKSGLGFLLFFLMIFFFLNVLIQKYYIVPANDLNVERGGLIDLAKNKEWFPKVNPFSMLLHFMIGSLGSYIYIQLKKDQNYSYDLIGSIVVIIIAYFLVHSGWNFSFFNLPYWGPVFPLLIVTLILCLTKSKQLYKLWDNKITIFIAKISFGLYVWHLFIYNIFYLYFIHYFLIFGKLHSIVMCLVAYFLTAFIATVSWYFLEKPCVEYFKRQFF